MESLSDFDKILNFLWKYAKFETYVVWWDGYFNQDGTKVDVDNDGHWVYVHKDSAGFKLTCAPEPMTMLSNFWVS